MRNKNSVVNKDKFDKLVAQHKEQKEQKEKVVKEFTEKYEEARSTAEKARQDMKEAQKTYDPTAMLEAKIRLNASEEVEKVFEETLNQEKRRSLYSGEEMDSLIREAIGNFNEMNEAANYALGEIASKMLPILDDAQQLFLSTTDFITDVAGIEMSSHYIFRPTGLLANLLREINHDRQAFPEYISETKL